MMATIAKQAKSIGPAKMAAPPFPPCSDATIKEVNGAPRIKPRLFAKIIKLAAEGIRSRVTALLAATGKSKNKVP